MKTTGRKFRCVSNKEVKLCFWGQFFTAGDIYPEVVSELDMLLLGEDNNTWFVDASQFELVEQ